MENSNSRSIISELQKEANEQKYLELMNKIGGEENIDKIFNSNLLDNQNLYVDSSNELDNFTTMNLIYELTESLYGKTLISFKDLELQSKQNEQLGLMSNRISVDDFLRGGFLPGRIYEFQGSTLSGKTHFINQLLLFNYDTYPGKILFFDSNNSFTYTKFSRTYSSIFLNNSMSINKKRSKKNSKIKSPPNFENKITHVEVTDFKQFYLQLKNYQEQIQKNEYNFIIIDSLSTVASKFSLDKKRDHDLILKVEKILLYYVNRCNVGLIYTNFLSRHREKELKNFADHNITKMMTVKEYIGYMVSSLNVFPNYIFTFYYENSNTNILGLKTRKYLVQIKNSRSSLSADVILQLSE